MEQIVENVTKVKAVELKLTLLIKEFLNEKQAFFREDYQLAAFMIKRHIERHYRIEVFTTAQDCKNNENGAELVINKHNVTEFEDNNSICLMLYISTSEETFAKLKARSFFKVEKKLMRKQFESGNNFKETDFAIEITNKLNVETVNDTFIRKVDEIETELSYML